MARPKEFDVDAALQRALAVFWQQGYAATSMQDLVGAMGIQRASLCGTFGDKHRLYIAALTNYQRDSLAAIERTLTAAASPLAALRELVQGAVATAAGRCGRRGCFCVNANIELAPHDGEVQQLLQAHGERVEQVLAAAIARAQAVGELPARADRGSLATFLYGVLVAISALGKQRPGRPRLQALADQALRALTAG